jgi:predicted RecA/RadA family phage recombinase
MKKTITSLLLVLGLLLTSIHTIAAPPAHTTTGRTLEMVAPVGGVVSGTPYVVNNVFLVALETKEAGQSFSGLYKDVIVTLPYYHGTVYKGQHAHWWESQAVVTDYEGHEIGFFTEDCVPTDATCDVWLTGRAFEPQFRAFYPLDINGLPQEINVTMAAGSGTASIVLPDWVEGFEGEITTNGNWNNNGTLTLTFTIPGTTAADVWNRAIIAGVTRETILITSPDTLTVTMKNISGGVVSAGSRITRGLLWHLGTREE